MVSKDFKVDDLVWAKMKYFPFWPAKIINPPADSKMKKVSHYVIFFGTNDVAWILNENIVPHSDEQVQSFSCKRKSPSLQKAIDTIVEEHKTRPKTSKPLVKEITVKKKKKLIKKRSSLKMTKHSGNKITKVKSSTSKKRERSRKKRNLHSAGEDGVVHHNASSSNGRQREDLAEIIQNDVLGDAIPFTDSFFSMLAQAHNSEFYPIPILNLQVVSDSLIQKEIVPTAKKIGFIGLGMMGQRMVKNLLHSGHDVTIWNRSPEKCAAFYNIGAHATPTPADVVTNCDIVFSCVSNSAAVKSIVFGNFGILMGLESKGFEFKGYVEMSSIDPFVSQEIAEAISNRGGKYLEAPVNGSLQEADEGALIILAAGDLQLYMETKTCFCAMSRHLDYLGSEIGKGSKLSLIVRTVEGTACAALAEAMALLERNNLSPYVFLKILNLEPYKSAFLTEKGKRMTLSNFETNNALKHQLNNLQMTLRMANSSQQPMEITAASNDLYKYAKRLDFSDHDVSSVVLGVLY